MGAFDQVAKNILIPNDEGDPKAAAAFRSRWGWEAHEVVIMRGVMTAGDTEAIGNASLLKDAENNPVFAAGSGRLALLERMIVGWTFTIAGNTVPVTSEAIRRLPTNYSTPLLQKCDELASGMTKKEQKDFFSSANGHTSENSGEAKPSLFPS